MTVSSRPSFAMVELDSRVALRRSCFVMSLSRCSVLGFVPLSIRGSAR